MIGDERDPVPRLLDWLGASRTATTRRCAGTTTRRSELLTVLVKGTSRSWRFLETTGLLERALPELADAVARRRADPFVLEPAHVLHFAVVERSATSR